MRQYLNVTEIPTRNLCDNLKQAIFHRAVLSANSAYVQVAIQEYDTYYKQALSLVSNGQSDEATFYFDRAQDRWNTMLEKAQEEQQLKQQNQTQNFKTLNSNGFIQKLAQMILYTAHDGIQGVYGDHLQCRTYLKSKSIYQGKLTILDSNGNPIHLTKSNEDLDRIEVIWQGRNQAQHYPKITNTYLIECFDVLIEDLGQTKLNGYNGNLKSYEVLEFLNWLDYESYSTSMLELEK
ncbi:hypothetical protein [Bacillus subtilis]|uniref:hypothetical protein n=1 Tax=Bacillus subtilis TaxID=1423 RepID=UPI003F7428D1